MMIFPPQAEKVIGVFHQQPLRRDLPLLETHPLKKVKIFKVRIFKVRKGSENRTHLSIVHGAVKNPTIPSTPKVRVDNAESTLFESLVRNNRYMSTLRLITKDNKGTSGKVG